MRKVECDACGKLISIKDAYDEDGHTTINGFVRIEYEESRDYYGSYDICVSCLEKIERFAKTLKEAQNDTNN